MTDITRKLATITPVVDCFKHPNADNLNIVKVRGWQCVTTEMYGIGDPIVYFEIDSFLPIRPEFEFLRKSCYRNIPELGEGFRIKTIRLRGELSQGLTLPVEVALGMPWSEFVSMTGISQDDIDEGYDVTEFLGVQKFELPIPAQLMGQIEGNFPSFIRKTDQERIQNLYNEVMLDKATDMSFLANVPVDLHKEIIERIEKRNLDKVKVRQESFETTLKLDGSSCTIFIKDGQYGVCSRNMQLKINEDNAENTFVKIANKLKHIVDDMAKCTGSNFAIQGEVMGPGIQGNREQLKDTQLFVFDIFDIDRQQYVCPIRCRELCELFGLDHVPVIETDRKPFEEGWTLDMFLAYANRQSLKHPIVEGVVFKSNESQFSFKVINNKFLEKEKD